MKGQKEQKQQIASLSNPDFSFPGDNEKRIISLLIKKEQEVKQQDFEQWNKNKKLQNQSNQYENNVEFLLSFDSPKNLISDNLYSNKQSILLRQMETHTGSSHNICNFIQNSQQNKPKLNCYEEEETGNISVEWQEKNKFPAYNVVQSFQDKIQTTKFQRKKEYQQPTIRDHNTTPIGK